MRFSLYAFSLAATVMTLVLGATYIGVRHWADKQDRERPIGEAEGRTERLTSGCFVQWWVWGGMEARWEKAGRERMKKCPEETRAPDAYAPTFMMLPTGPDGAMMPFFY